MGDEQRVEREIVVGASPEDVWRAVTDDAELSAWFGADVALDARPGGAGRFDEPGAAPRHATVETVDEGRRLVWRWWPAGGDGQASRVELTVDRVAGGTRLTVVEVPVASSGTGGASLRAARAAAWERRLLALELRCLVPAGV